MKRIITLLLLLSSGICPDLSKGSNSSSVVNGSDSTLRNKNSTSVVAEDKLSFDTLCTPNPSPEAVALFRYIQDMYGKKMISGQMCTPWGIDELKYIKDLTGKLPAMRGMDFIHERDNITETQQAIDWWKAGGIPTIMWHWGAPAVGEGYENSKVEIDIAACFREGTPEYKAMWAELKIKADHLQTLRDANVPVLWRPFHELNGNWFWWGKQGPELFKQLWLTMYNYFVMDRGLNNLIWVLCYTGEPNGDWNPGIAYYDIAGADTYGGGSDPHLKMFNEVRDIVQNNKIPIAYHECGVPPDPDQCLSTGAMWSWWMEWHTSWLTKVDKDYLHKVYDHELVITLDEVPDIVSLYQQQQSMDKIVNQSFSDFIYTDIGVATKPGTAAINSNEIKIMAAGADIWGTHDEFLFGYKKLTGNFDISVQILSLDKPHQYTKAGLMARADLSDSSQHVYFQVFPDNSPRNKNNGGCEFQYRSVKAGDMKAIYPDPETAGNQFDVDFPDTWIRLKRQGDVFESYFSKDNKTWKLYSSFTLVMPAELFVGTAVTSHNSTEYTTAGFSLIQLKR
jgi:hypothetical protein